MLFNVAADLSTKQMSASITTITTHSTRQKYFQRKERPPLLKQEQFHKNNSFKKRITHMNGLARVATTGLFEGCADYLQPLGAKRSLDSWPNNPVT